MYCCWHKRSTLSIEKFFSKRGPHLGWESIELSFSVISKMTKSKVSEMLTVCLTGRQWICVVSDGEVLVQKSQCTHVVSITTCWLERLHYVFEYTGGTDWVGTLVSVGHEPLGVRNMKVDGCCKERRLKNQMILYYYMQSIVLIAFQTYSYLIHLWSSFRDGEN